MARRRQWSSGRSEPFWSGGEHDPNSGYTPRGWVKLPELKPYQFQDLATPRFIGLPAGENGSSYVTDDGELVSAVLVKFSNTAKYDVPSEAIPRILLDKISIDEYLDLPFSAPRPELRRANPPTMPSQNDLNLPAPSLDATPPEPILIASPRSTAYSILLPGIYHLIHWISITVARGKFRVKHEEWVREKINIEGHNKQLLAAFEVAVREHPFVKIYHEAQLHFEAREFELDIKYRSCVAAWTEAANQYVGAQRSAREMLAYARLEGVGNPATAAWLASVVWSFCPLRFVFPRGLSAHLDQQQNLLLLTIEVPSSDNVIITKLKTSKTGNTRTPLPMKAHKNSYEFLIYSITVRILVEIARCNTFVAIELVAANIVSRYKSPKTGLDTDAMIASVLVNRETAASVDLEHLNPIETFRSWRGVASKNLAEMVPVKPVVVFNGDDRIVRERDVLSNDDLDNLAAMDWEDFEHLVRQLFELEFSSTGTDVKITRSSRDRGVDAIMYDPDPIKGGTIVIQAKRYTTTVDVSAVRDLYGTIQNEGANKGILVTTSQFGPDSREFAKNKPITLLDGQNLLFLLEKHGYRFRIDLAEARATRDT